MTRIIMDKRQMFNDVSSEYIGNGYNYKGFKIRKWQPMFGGCKWKVYDKNDKVIESDLFNIKDAKKYIDVMKQFH